MEEASTDTKENFQVNEDLWLSLDKDTGVAQDNDLMLSGSKLKVVLERLKQDKPLTSENKQQRVDQRCFQERSHQNQCVTELGIPKCMSSVSPHENLAQHGLGLLEIRASDSVSIFCRVASATPLNFPLNLRSSKLEILFDSLKSHRRTRSTSDLGVLFTESVLAAGPGNVIFSPVGQWFTDAIDRNNTGRNLMKTPLIRHLSALDGNMNLGKAKSSGVKDSRCSELIRSPLGKSISSPQNQVKEIRLPRRLRYGSEITDKTLFSLSSTNSTSSYQSTSSFGGAASTGLLHCIWKDGLPYFMFSVDGRGDAYVASPCKVESSADKAFDYIYLFHSSINDKKEPRAENVSGLVGKMKVSSSITLSSDNLKDMETEFILFGTGEEGFMDVKSSSRTLRRNKGLPKKVVDMFKTNHLYKHKTIAKSCISGDLSHVPCLDMLSSLDELGKMNIIESYLPPNLELAAIVVKGSHCEKTQEAVVGGWGLKFLKKVTMEDSNSCPHSSSGSCQHGRLRNQSRPINSLNVLVPAGLHGGPKTRNGGPSSLTERWRSGGHCDCGGWDIGCPLTVLNCQSSNVEGSPKADAQDCSSFDLFVEGAKEGEPALKMVNIHEGLHFIHFKSTLSALQSFSIGVAILHSRSPSLCPKLYRS